MFHETWKGFFALEGLDGSGTTTQLRSLAALAAETGRSQKATFEPTDGPVGAFLRKVLKGAEKLTHRSLALLFAADRQEHLFGENGIAPLLSRGTQVVTDRYLFSSLAYQSLDLPWEAVWALNKDFPFPEKVFFLDIDVKTAQERILRRGEGMELFDEAKLQEKIRLGYEETWKRLSDEGLSLIRIDAKLSPSEITTKIWDEMGRSSVEEMPIKGA